MAMFDAQAALEEAGDFAPFSFVGLDGENYTLPNPLTLTERQAARINRGEIKELVAEIAPEAWSAIEEMPIHVSQKLAEAWLEGAGESGKSPRPSRRTNGGGKRSRRT